MITPNIYLKSNNSLGIDRIAPKIRAQLSKTLNLGVLILALVTTSTTATKAVAEDGMMDSHSAAHMSLLNLVHYDHLTHTTTTAGGNWSQTATWADGIIPSDGDRVLVTAGSTVTVDTVIPAKLMSLRVDGDLLFSTISNSELTVDTMVISKDGTLTMGTEGDPILWPLTAKIIIEDYDNGGIFRELDSPHIDNDIYQIGQGLIALGAVEMHGTPKKHGVTLATEAKDGDSTITLSEKVRNWKVGDTIVIAGTNSDALGDEMFTIASIKYKKIITLEGTIAKDHSTPNHSKEGLDLKVHVINITRNVSVETAEAGRAPFPVDEVNGMFEYNSRGHVMFMHNLDVKLQYAGFYGLGRSNKIQRAHDTGDHEVDVTDEDGNLVRDDDGKIIKEIKFLIGTNQRGRYAVHFHQAGIDGPAAIVKDCAVHGSPGWGFVNHSSRVEFTHNVAYDVKAASFVTEAGDELGKFIENISIRNTIDEDYKNTADLRFQKRKKGESRDEFAFGGHGFWYQGINVISQRNVASGAGREAFAIYPLKQHGRLSDTVPRIELSNPDEFGADNIGIGAMRAHTFEDETAYGSNIGLMVAEHRPTYSSIVKNFLGWRVKMGLTTNYSDRVAYEDLTLIGDRDKPAGLGSFAHHGAANIHYINPHIEGFALGLQLPRGGNSDLVAVDINPNSEFKTGDVVNGYFNNLINIHFPFVRTHTPLRVEIINPKFETLPNGVIPDALIELAKIDKDPDLDIDSSNKGGNGFEELSRMVAANEIDRSYDYLFHDTSGPNVPNGSTIHKRDLILPNRFFVDRGDKGTYQLFIKASQEQDHVIYPTEDFTPDDGFIDADEDGTNDWGKWEVPIELLGLTTAEAAEFFQENAYHTYVSKLFSPAKTADYPNNALSIAGSMLPRDYADHTHNEYTDGPESTDGPGKRFKIWDHAHNIVAMRIDDLPDYKTFLQSPNQSVVRFDFTNSDNPLKYRLDKPAAWHAAPMKLKLDKSVETRTSLFLDGAGDALQYAQPFHQGFKTTSWIANVRPLETTTGVIYEWESAGLPYQEWDSSGAAYQIKLNNGKIVVTIKTDTATEVQIEGGNLQAGMWYQIALVINFGHGKAYLYIDGVRVGSIEINTITGTERGLARIGRSFGESFSEATPYRGFIENLHILERSFTDADLNNYYRDYIADKMPDLDQRSLDTDLDGVDDLDDAFPLNPSEDSDTDGDGLGDNSDTDPSVPFTDTDGDRAEIYGGDAIPDDATEWSDVDDDGTGDNSDEDTDDDGVNNDVDQLPLDPNEQFDNDGDGVGDNVDQFDNDPTEWIDTDGDGTGDNADMFDNDPDETLDTDGDGWGDHQADKFPHSKSFKDAENLLLNPGAENGIDGLDGWVSTNSAEELEKTSETIFHKGLRSFVLDPNGEADAKLQLITPPSFNPHAKAINISGWAKAGTATDLPKDTKVSIRSAFSGAGTKRIEITLSDYEWTHFSEDFTVDDLSGLNSYFIINEDGDSIVYIDDLRISTQHDGLDTDDDGTPDYADDDDDGDDYIDGDDAFDDDPSEWLDTDGDKTGNNADDDDDDDGILDTIELSHGLDPLNDFDAQADYDEDGQANEDEIIAGTDLFDRSSMFEIKTQQMNNDGHVELSWTGAPSKTYYIEYSTDLAEWAILPGAEAVNSTDGFTDTDANEAGIRFYRIGIDK